MSKALKILGTDFSTNAITQITYDEEIPCTGLSLDQSTLSFETLEESIQLTAIPVPADTTDEVAWASSNESVATVVNGLVTIHGIGSATITATCGNQSATATISQTSIKSNYAVYKDVGYNFVANYDLYIIRQANSDSNGYGKSYTNNNALRIGPSDSKALDQIPVPYGATKVKVAMTSGNAVTISNLFRCDMNDIYIKENEYPVGRYPKYKSKSSSISSATGAAVVYGECICFTITNTNLSTDSVSYVYFE